MEQLALLRLLDAPDATLGGHRARLREQRDALVAAVRERLPEWRFRVPGVWPLALVRAASGPVAGLGLAPLADEAEQHGVIIAPGPVFAPDGAASTASLRIPWTRRVDELEDAVRRIAEAWAVVASRQPGPRPVERPGDGGLSA